MWSPIRVLRLPVVVTACAVALSMTACGGRIQEPAGPGATAGEEPPASAAATSEEPSAGVAGASLPRCDEIPHVSAPAEWYRDSPIYVANEMPVLEVRDWAAAQPGYEEIWIDRDHLGWITVAFSIDAEARQRELEERFPGVGVVAVEVVWTMAELVELQDRVGAEIGPLFPMSSSISVTQGVVDIGVGVLKEERLAAIEERFAGERICVEGTDPADAPAEGPQPPGGDGWRLLADELVGEPYRTWIASDQASYERLWNEIGLSGDPRPVDFQSEVVIWFGAVYGSSCPDIRLDDVLVDRERALVYAEIVLVDAPTMCTSDARPHAYVVAVERGTLPSGPFAIQLDAADPPPGALEERTLVEVDLSEPGTAAGPGDVRAAPPQAESNVLSSGAIVEPGYPATYRLFVHCGIEWLGEVNSVAWRTDVPDGSLDFVPPQWQAAVDDQFVELSVLMLTDPEPLIEATANGHTVTYRPTAEEPPGCD